MNLAPFKSNLHRTQTSSRNFRNLLNSSRIEGLRRQPKTYTTQPRHNGATVGKFIAKRACNRPPALLDPSANDGVATAE